MNDFKRKMKEKIKTYSKKEYLAEYMKNEYTTLDKDADVYLNIGERDEIFDSWTVENQIDLENDIYEFVEEKIEMLECDIPINLHILGYEFTSKEEGMIKHLFKEHYSIELYKIQREYKKTRNKAINMLVIGFVSLLIYFYFIIFNDNDIPSEIFAFLFSFSLWESFDSIIYNLSEIKEQREKITQLLLMDVDFENERDDDK